MEREERRDNCNRLHFQDRAAVMEPLLERHVCVMTVTRCPQGAWPDARGVTARQQISTSKAVSQMV